VVGTYPLARQKLVDAGVDVSALPLGCRPDFRFKTFRMPEHDCLAREFWHFAIQ
jgi:hypothetical protein